MNLYKHDIKNTWKTIKNAMNTSKNCSNISKIKCDNVTSEDPIDIAETFNTYFSSIGKNLAQKISPANKQFSEFLGVSNPNSIFFVPTHRNEIIKIVSSLDNNKSPGHDCIGNYLLKNIISYVVDPLVHIVNLSLTSGLVPSNMKIAKVIPIFKKGDKCDVSNYRPISLLTTISKILERIIYIRTANFF